MKSALDNEFADLTCPQCGHKFKERLGKLKANPTLACPGCQVAIPIEADKLRVSLQKVDKSLADLQRTARRLFK